MCLDTPHCYAYIRAMQHSTIMEGEVPSGLRNPNSYRVHTDRMTVLDTMTIDESVELIKSQMAGPVTLLLWLIT